MTEPKRLTMNRVCGAAFAIAAGALLAISCGNAVVDPPPCNGVQCPADSNLTCDPGDGVCKCGGEGGVMCGASGTCAEVGGSRTCVYNCGEVKCGNGTSLDPLDCTCKCGGQGGAVCEAGARCDTALRKCYVPARCVGVACNAGMTCDGLDGQCKCGGVACGKFQVCQGGQCVTDPCSGVNCSGGTVCNPADGNCHCGGKDGLVCTQGEACGCPNGAETCAELEKQCRPTTNCRNAQCLGGTTCDPQDGLCKCGGHECQPGQTCDVLNQICVGADRCKGVLCHGGLTCDPDTGTCKCGGLSGQICATGEICVVTADRSKCAVPCDPRTPTCTAAQSCHFDVWAKVGYCMKDDPAKKEGTGCVFRAMFNPSTDVYPCALGFHCQSPAGEEAGSCRKYCDTTHGDGDCSGGNGAQACDLLDSGPRDLGACKALN